MRIRKSYAYHAFSPQPCLMLFLVDLMPIIARAWLAVASYLNVAHLGRWFRSGTYYMVTITKGVGVHPCTRPYRHRTTEAPSIPGASKPRDVIHQPDLDAGQPHHHSQFALGSTAVIVAAVHQTFANQTACADCSIESPSSNPCRRNLCIDLGLRPSSFPSTSWSPTISPLAFARWRSHHPDLLPRLTHRRNYDG